MINIDTVLGYQIQMKDNNQKSNHSQCLSSIDCVNGQGGEGTWYGSLESRLCSSPWVNSVPMKLQNTTLSIVLWANKHFTSYVFFLYILRKPKQHSRENRPTTTHSVSYRTTAYSKARAYHKTHSTSCQVRLLFSFILSFCSFSSHHGLMLCSNLAATK